jgi:hypothetical protein
MALIVETLSLPDVEVRRSIDTVVLDVSSLGTFRITLSRVDDEFFGLFQNSLGSFAIHLTSSLHGGSLHAPRYDIRGGSPGSACIKRFEARELLKQSVYGDVDLRIAGVAVPMLLHNSISPYILAHQTFRLRADQPSGDSLIDLQLDQVRLTSSRIALELRDLPEGSYNIRVVATPLHPCLATIEYASYTAGLNYTTSSDVQLYLKDDIDGEQTLDLLALGLSQLVYTFVKYEHFLGVFSSDAKLDFGNEVDAQALAILFEPTND